MPLPCVIVIVLKKGREDKRGRVGGVCRMKKKKKKKKKMLLCIQVFCSSKSLFKSNHHPLLLHQSQSPSQIPVQSPTWVPGSAEPRPPSSSGSA
jgi:hypothetical protein